MTQRSRESDGKRRQWRRSWIWLRPGRSLSYARLLTISRTSGIRVKIGELRLGCGSKPLPFRLQRAIQPAIGPVHSQPDGFSSELLPPALHVLAELVRRLHAIAGAVPLNAWLHNHASGWRLVLLPRLSTIAALELGGGVWINTVAPEAAAAAFRNAG